MSQIGINKPVAVLSKRWCSSKLVRTRSVLTESVI
jgi:hypothetical protein